MTAPRIIVHGGAWAIPDALVTAHREGCRRAAELALAILRDGGLAEDAVEAAVIAMEDDETFDAGRGSFLNRDGDVELDAAFMEGRALQVGAVAAVRDIANPIRLARMVMESEHVLLVGEGATRFGLDHGMERCPPDWLIIPREVAFWRHQHAEAEAGALDALRAWRSDTVGAIALDDSGHFAAAVSTGGRPYKLPGRVGDVPCTGAGFYVDDEVGAALSTGDGEAIARIVMAKRAVDALAQGEAPQEATRGVIDYLYQRVGGHAGIILMSRDAGHKTDGMGCAFNTTRMARAWNEGGRIVAAVNR
jgi:L-asparaginase / beta-aspartyl-peptidase